MGFGKVWVIEETFFFFQLTRFGVEKFYKFMLLGVLEMLWIMVMVYVVWFVSQKCCDGIIIKDKDNSWE
jgi:hypothetical protein